MSYFTINTVSKAYDYVSLHTKEKFWGILGILYSIDSYAHSNIAHSINPHKLSNYLESIFRIKDKKNYPLNNTRYSVIFSNNWESEIKENFLNSKPNILPIIIWAYRNSFFSHDYTVKELLEKFICDFHINIESLKKLFDINLDEFPITYSEILYNDIDLLNQLNISGISTVVTLKLNRSYVVANAGDLTRGPFFQPLYASLDTLKCLIIFPFEAEEYYKFFPKNNYNHTIPLKYNNQIIFYGCPGTGKSHAVKRQTEGESVVRTTFHPDSDYSTFVGSYKPTTKQGPRYTSYGEKAVTIKDAGGKELVEDRIVYEFVDQAFLQAYIRAWKFLAEAEEGTLPKKQYLIIEEINRGNCAQIFGDLFQLLDRNDKGFSDYYIHADKDIQKHLAAAFEDLTITDALKEEINSQHQGEDIVTKVLSGEILLLPSNLYIWATMNTSDQSLFPIDSAFKRRWDWKYQPIVKGRDPEGNELNWQIEGDIQNYDWWSFIGKINEVIASTTNSEDKKLGFFFCKAKDGVISAETFVSKVIFYLWNDVFKNFGFDTTIFKDEDGSTLEFDKFYTSSPTGETIVDKAKVEQFLANLEVEATKETIEEVEEDEDVTTGTSDLSKYTINGSTESWGKNALAAACVQKFIELHPDMSAEEVLNTWKPLSNGVPHFIETEEQHNARTDKAKNRCERISCGGTLLYVEKNNYTQKNGKIEALINAINEREGEWGIRVDKVE